MTHTLDNYIDSSTGEHIYAIHALTTKILHKEYYFEQKSQNGEGFVADSWYKANR